MQDDQLIFPQGHTPRAALHKVLKFITSQYYSSAEMDITVHNAIQNSTALCCTWQCSAGEQCPTVAAVWHSAQCSPQGPNYPGHIVTPHWACPSLPQLYSPSLTQLSCPSLTQQLCPSCPDPAALSQPDPAVLSQPDPAVLSQPDPAVLSQPDPAVQSQPDPAVLSQPDQAVLSQPFKPVPSSPVFRQLFTKRSWAGMQLVAAYWAGNHFCFQLLIFPSYLCKWVFTKSWIFNLAQICTNEAASNLNS